MSEYLELLWYFQDSIMAALQYGQIIGCLQQNGASDQGVDCLPLLQQFLLLEKQVCLNLGEVK